MDIKEKVAVITGGASGLGAGCARLFVEHGAKVAILDRARDKGDTLAGDLGAAAIFCPADVSDEQDVQAAINATMDAFGAVHVAVSCAGMAIPAPVLGKDGPVPMRDFKLVLNVNLVGTMNVVRLAAERMIKNRPNDDGEKGVIINTASAAAFDGTMGLVSYAAAKAGIVAMTLPLAREFADYGLRVVTISPGNFDTPLYHRAPKQHRESWQPALLPKRLGLPEEFARLALHVVENPMLNAETIRLDAGARGGN